MNIWQSVKVAELGRIVTGKTPKTAITENYGGDILFLTPSDDMSVKYVSNTAKTLTERGVSEVKNALLPPDTVCVSCIGSDLGKVVITSKNTVTNQQINSIIVDKKRFDVSFVYYAMLILGKELNFISKTSTAVPIVNKSSFSAYKILCPSLEQQKKIVTILSALDSKIECNKQINDNLLLQARALFFECFIKTPQDCATHETELGILPADYSVIKTGELPMIVTDYVANGSFASLKENVQLYQERNYAYFIRNTDLKAGTFEVFVDEHSYNFLAKSRLFGGEIIISNVGDVGSVFLCPRLDAPMTLGNNIIMLKPSQDELRYYLYIWFKWSLGQGLMQGIKGGSAQPKFNKTDFKSLPVILPPQDILLKFHEAVCPMFEMIEVNQTENRQLAALRDSILPKLMSGEIDVSAVQL